MAAAQSESLLVLLGQLAGLVAGRGGVKERHWAAVTSLLAADAARVSERAVVIRCEASSGEEPVGAASALLGAAAAEATVIAVLSPAPSQGAELLPRMHHERLALRTLTVRRGRGGVVNTSPN